jgi:hypothetical protein
LAVTVRRLAFAASFGVCAALGVSCLLDTSGLIGGAVPGADGGSGLDGTVEAGAIPSDGSSPSPVTADGGGCAGGVWLLCDDFDDRDAGAPGGPAWDKLIAVGAGVLRLDSTDAVSHPNSLFTSVPAHAVLVGQQMLGRTLALPASKKITVELDLQLSYQPAQVTAPGAYGWVVSIGDDKHFESLDIQGDSVAFDMQKFAGAANPYLDVPPLFPPDSAWHHVKIEMTFDATAGGASVTVDGKTYTSFGMDTIGTTVPTSVTVSIGTATDTAKGGWPEARTRHDNVRIY